ncbi:MAG: HAMP domain-containing sensor histidine kinase [Candidatus Neomarinimicrobiota bacterium]
MGFEGVTRDVTERKRSERAIKQSEQAYNALSEKLTKANKMKELLLDIISHDLMNPAGVIQGMSELLENEFPDNTMAGVIKDSSESLIRVIKNAATLSKISMGEKIKTEVLDLVKIIQEVVPEFSLQLEGSGMTCEFKLPKTIRIKANPIIAEVFKNYISNAIKYSAAGKRILFESRLSKSAVTINVIDFGPAVPKEKRELIFEREFQLENKTRKGKGLGLAIVKRIALAHNATVGVKPNKPEGNIFYIKIPKKL